jgi:hypothetical protein
MKKIVLCAFGCALSLNGCAVVPDLEPEQSFSYAEIVTQLQCELYLASEKLRHEMSLDQDAANPFEPLDWVATISLQPDIQSDVGVNLGAAWQSNLTKTYSKFSSGGGSATSSGVELNGDAASQNQYNLSISNLYLSGSGIERFKKSLADQPNRNIYPNVIPGVGARVTISYPEDGKNRAVSYSAKLEKTNGDIFYEIDEPGSALNGFRLIHPRLRHQCLFTKKEAPIPDSLNPAAKAIAEDAQIAMAESGAYPSELGGVFGLYGYMQRSLAAMQSGTVDVTSFQFTNSYRLNILVGVTAGWYGPLGSIGPSAGAYKKLYDQIQIIMKKATKPSSPAFEYVCLIADPTKKDKTCLNQVIIAQSAPPAAPKGAAEPHAGGGAVAAPPSAAAANPSFEQGVSSASIKVIPAQRFTVEAAPRKAKKVPLAVDRNPVSEADKVFMSNSINLQFLQRQLPSQ